MEDDANKFDITVEDSDFPQVVKVPDYADIVFGEGTTVEPGIYYQCNNYDTITYANYKEYWHQILVYHNGALTKDAVLDKFYEIFRGTEFNPVMYRTGKNVDQFLVRLIKNQLSVLFGTYLKLTINNELIIHLRIKLNVAKALPEHITARSKIKSLISKCPCTPIDEHITLNLNGLSEKTDEIIIRMTHTPTQKMVFWCVVDLRKEKDMSKYWHFTGLSLQHNNLKNLEPLTVFARQSHLFRITYLDLSQNKIDSINEVYFLKPYQLAKLKIAGNPVSRNKSTIAKIKEIMPSLTDIDGRKYKAFSVPLLQSDVGDFFDTANFNIAQYEDSTKWHHVIVLHEGRCGREQILDAFFEMGHDTAFYPCYYHEFKNNHLFFMRNCYDLLKSIHTANLQLSVNGMVIPVRLRLNANEYLPSEFDPVQLVTQEVNERYNKVNKTMDLSAFHIKWLTSDNVIINLAHTKILTNILILVAKQFGSELRHLNLASNRIRSVGGQVLFPLVNMTSLVGLDLSDNNISDSAGLFNSVVKLKLTELNLTNNPFLETINGRAYLKEVTKKFTALEKLDGHTIIANKLTFNRNYLCNLEYYDFVETFVKNYFLLYDSQIRCELIDFYHPKAMYSMSMNYAKSRISGANAERISRYTEMSQNILTCTNFRRYTNLFIGNKHIISHLATFPTTEHDYHSFLIDVPHASANLILITITGILKELASTLLDKDLWMGFTRTFVFKPQSTGVGLLNGGIDYRIYNEHMHLYNLNKVQVKNGFKRKVEAIVDLTNDGEVILPRQIDPKYENDCLNQIFMFITKLKMKWSVQFLTRTQWKLVPAIQYFLQLEKCNKIPEIAFDRN